MSMLLDELERQARALPPDKKAALVRILIEDLDTASDPDADRLWIEEAQRRHEAYQRGELEARPGAEVMQRVRGRLG